MNSKERLQLGIMAAEMVHANSSNNSVSMYGMRLLKENPSIVPLYEAARDDIFCENLTEVIGDFIKRCTCSHIIQTDFDRSIFKKYESLKDVLKDILEMYCEQTGKDVQDFCDHHDNRFNSEDTRNFITKNVSYNTIVRKLCDNTEDVEFLTGQWFGKGDNMMWY